MLSYKIDKNVYVFDLAFVHVFVSAFVSMPAAS